jgi:hypothetical protein
VAISAAPENKLEEAIMDSLLSISEHANRSLPYHQKRTHIVTLELPGLTQ